MSKEKKSSGKPRNGFVEFMTLLWRTKKVAFFGMVVLILFILVAIFADFIAPQKMENGLLSSHLMEAAQAPSLKHPLGTDAMGVDLLSYMIYGARTSVILGVSCTILSTLISVIIGVASAVIGGKFDLFLQRFIDAWQCIPGMLIMLILMTMLGAGMGSMIVVLSVPGGIGGSRMIRSAAISVKDSGYCNMSKMLGGKNLWRMIHHVLPNILPLVLMNLANSLGGTIMMEATLNFLGFGVNVGTPSWGYILTSQGRSKMYTAPWIGLAPGLAITIMVFAAAMFGDGVRDILDPRLKGGMGSFSKEKIGKIAKKYMASKKAQETA
ncbi:MAG: ABC transporter permease [Oscillospiraceae bacterium]|nr:ABC transporter permease [Oscillospiraceae bacterium]